MIQQADLCESHFNQLPDDERSAYECREAEMVYMRFCLECQNEAIQGTRYHQIGQVENEMKLDLCADHFEKLLQIERAKYTLVVCILMNASIESRNK